jgi:predicted acetyltransferase
MVEVITNLKKQSDFLIRPYINSDLAEMISLIKRSDSTDRSDMTWSENLMTGVLGFYGNKLIGAIPFESRNFALGNGDIIKALWVSAAHVDPEYRSKGLGRKLDQLARKTFYPEYQGIFVYRGDENSLAYKWYTRMGYHVLLRILSLRMGVVHTESNIDYRLYSSLVELASIETEIYKCYQKNNGDYGGGAYRHKSFWSEKLYAHYYHKHNRYYTLVLHKGKHIESYAILGETKYRDGVERFDILEYCCPDNNFQRERLLSAIMFESSKKKLKEIRIQISNQDPGLRWFDEFGFRFRWRTNLMGTLIKPIEYFINNIKKCNEFEDCIITIEIPSLGTHSVGSGPKKLGLFMSENEFVKLLLFRTDLMTAIVEGRILITQHDDKKLKAFNCLVPFKKWRHNQIDYI